jgi:hypothetical protein
MRGFSVCLNRSFHSGVSAALNINRCLHQSNFTTHGGQGGWGRVGRLPQRKSR